jgi:hypothetical protein
MRTIRLSVVLAALLALPACAPESEDTLVAEEEVALGTQDYEARRIAIHAQMQRLLADQVAWNRAMTVSVLAKLDDTNATVARLRQSQTRFADTLAGWYGPAARLQILDLLGNDLRMGVKWTYTLRDGKADEKLHAARLANAADTAAFICRLSPSLNLAEVRDLWVGLVDEQAAQAEARMVKDWGAEIAAYDQASIFAQKLSARLAAALIVQFPNWFGPAGPAW